MNFKFGVLYAKAGQITDNEMFSNSKLHPVYTRAFYFDDLLPYIPCVLGIGRYHKYALIFHRAWQWSVSYLFGVAGRRSETGGMAAVQR